VEGHVWVDNDGNGQRAENEGVPDALVTLEDAGRVSGSWQTTTDANGYYRFEAVPPGDYRLRVQPPRGYMPPPDVEVSVSAGGQTVVPEQAGVVSPALQIYLPLLIR
jgi:protocatechuate 3,4-dioxygenase beta subunit